MITYLVLCILGLIKKQSKTLVLFMLIYMWIIFSLNTYSGDFLNYEYVYNSILNGELYFEYEPAITLLMIICKTIGLSYINFRMIIGTIYIILIYYSANLYTKYTAYAISLYMIFPFLVYVSVFRAGLSGVIVTIAFKYLIDDKINATRKFFLIMSIAILFHYSSALYLGIVFLRKCKPNIKVFFIMMGSCILITLLYYSNILYEIAGIFIKNYRVLKYFDYYRNAVDINLKWALYRFIIVFVNIFILYLARTIWKRCRKKEDEKNVGKALDLTVNLNLLMIIILPLLFLSNVFIRWIYGITFINICVLALSMQEIKYEYKLFSYKYVSIKLIPQTIFLFWNVLLLIYANLPYVGTQNDTSRLFVDNLLKLF